MNLNKELTLNAKYFDLIAKRGGHAYAISVKTRNKFENSTAGRKLNSRYKLTDNPDLFEIEAKEKYNSLPAWIAISLDFDAGVFDAYFGLISDLTGNRKGIVMTPQATENYESLAKQIDLNQIGISETEMQSLKNVYNKQ